jgi:hypothetical protein
MSGSSKQYPYSKTGRFQRKGAKTPRRKEQDFSFQTSVFIFASLRPCALALNSCWMEGAKKWAFWKNEPILDFSRIVQSGS